MLDQPQPAGIMRMTLRARPVAAPRVAAGAAVAGAAATTSAAPRAARTRRDARRGMGRQHAAKPRAGPAKRPGGAPTIRGAPHVQEPMQWSLQQRSAAGETRVTAARAVDIWNEQDVEVDIDPPANVGGVVVTVVFVVRAGQVQARSGLTGDDVRDHGAKIGD